MRLPDPRGPLTAPLFARLAGAAPNLELPRPGDADPLDDDDLQLALFCAYRLHYGGFERVDDALEWDPAVIAFRAELERTMLGRLTAELGEPGPLDPGDVAEAVFAAVEADEGPPLARHIESRATLEQFREFVVHRSAYQLMEADPHTWALPRIDGPAKAAMVEIQADEYGGGRSERMHSRLFAVTMLELGLDPEYGAYVERLPGSTLATVNLMSLFGPARALRGALVGHLAVFEMSSPGPNRRYAPRAAPARLRRTPPPTSTTSTSRPTPCTRTSPPTTSPAGSPARSPSSQARSCSGSGRCCSARSGSRAACWRASAPAAARCSNRARSRSPAEAPRSPDQ